MALAAGRLYGTKLITWAAAVSQLASLLRLAFFASETNEMSIASLLCSIGLLLASSHLTFVPLG